jgi:S1-C subfamily serine protease
MKQSNKILLNLAAALFVGGISATAMNNVLVPDKNHLTFNEAFQQNPKSKVEEATVQPVDLTKASELAVHAVVHIRSTKASKVVTVDDDPFGGFFDDFFGNSGNGKRQVRTQPQVGIGSGVIISQDGYIVTNNHVVEGADEIEVTLNDNHSYKGRVIGTDASTDLALIKVAATESAHIASWRLRRFESWRMGYRCRQSLQPCFDGNRRYRQRQSTYAGHLRYERRRIVHTDRCCYQPR